MADEDRLTSIQWEYREDEPVAELPRGEVHEYVAHPVRRIDTRATSVERILEEASYRFEDVDAAGYIEEETPAVILPSEMYAEVRERTDHCIVATVPGDTELYPVDVEPEERLARYADSLVEGLGVDATPAAAYIRDRLEESVTSGEPVFVSEPSSFGEDVLTGTEPSFGASFFYQLADDRDV